MWDMSLYTPADKLFKKRTRGKRDRCVYQWRFEAVPDFPAYTGEGSEDRRTGHTGDLLAKMLKKLKAVLYILSDGLTKFESQVYESMLIRKYAFEYGLSKRGATDWDGHSILNKQRELTMEKYIEIYLY